MTASRISAGRAVLALAGAVALVAVLTVTAAGRAATASAAKGSSCAHPYEVHLGEQKGLYVAPLVGDTYYVTRSKRVLNEAEAFRRHTRLRVSYTWHALQGAHMCEYRIADIRGSHFRELVFDSHDPHGGTNVVVSERLHCGVLCGETQAESEEEPAETREVLTAARGAPASSAGAANVHPRTNHATARRSGAAGSHGASCAHPYEVHVGEQKGLYPAPLVGDTTYITRTFRAIRNPHPVFNHRGVFHLSYTWHARNGAKMCEFHVWEMVRYEASPGHMGGWELRQNILDSRNPRGGTNVVVPVLETTNAEALKIGEQERYEVLTAAR